MMKKRGEKFTSAQTQVSLPKRRNQRSPSRVYSAIDKTERIEKGRTSSMCWQEDRTDGISRRPKTAARRQLLHFLRVPRLIPLLPERAVILGCLLIVVRVVVLIDLYLNGVPRIIRHIRYATPIIDDLNLATDWSRSVAGISFLYKLDASGVGE